MQTPELRNSGESERRCNVSWTATFSGATLPIISAGEALRKQLQTDEDDDGGWGSSVLFCVRLTLISLYLQQRSVSQRTEWLRLTSQTGGQTSSKWWRFSWPNMNYKYCHNHWIKNIHLNLNTFLIITEIFQSWLKILLGRKPNFLMIWFVLIPSCLTASEDWKVLRLSHDPLKDAQNRGVVVIRPLKRSMSAGESCV